MLDTLSVVANWSARDEARGLLPVDREIVRGTAAARANIVEHVLRGGPHADLFHACAILGRLIATEGGSPTLAASTMDGLAEALRELQSPPPAAGDMKIDPTESRWVDSARAALAEGFAATLRELARVEN